MKSLKPRFVEGGTGIVARGLLSSAARQALLNKQFGSVGKVSFNSATANKPLFVLPSVQATLLDSDKYGFIEPQVEATTLRGHQDQARCCEMPKLVRYTGGNRYGTGRDAWAGGDDWVLPPVRKAVSALDNVVTGTLWNDFSNMNGGHFPPHKGHNNGDDVDGFFPNYDARSPAVAGRYSTSSGILPTARRSRRCL